MHSQTYSKNKNKKTTHKIQYCIHIIETNTTKNEFNHMPTIQKNKITLLQKFETNMEKVLHQQFVFDIEI